MQEHSCIVGDSSENPVCFDKTGISWHLLDASHKCLAIKLAPTCPYTALHTSAKCFADPDDHNLKKCQYKYSSKHDRILCYTLQFETFCLYKKLGHSMERMEEGELWM